MKPTLLDRYLAEIARNLPANKQRDDIVAEISDDLQSRIEAGEGSEYDVIKAYGPPTIVAARYGPQQYLISPTVLPIYWYTLRLVLAIVLGIEIFGSALGAFVLHSFSIFTSGVGAAWPSLFVVFGAVTLAFALIERFAKGAFVKWDPSALPAPSAAPVSRIESAFEFIANFTMLTIVLFAGPWFAKTIAPLAWTPAWQPAWYATILGTTIVCGTAFAVYLTPAWTKLRYINGIVSQLIMIAGSALTLGGGTLVTLRNPGGVGVAQLGVLNMMAQWSIGIVIITMLCSVAYNAWRLVQRSTARTGSQPDGNGHILNA
jgi:hypothetical protein